MALTKAQSRQIILDWRADIAALDTQVVTAIAAVEQARIALNTLVRQREPLVEEIRIMAQRHRRLFSEDA